MSNIEFIDTTDRHRVLLSEILPHEVPPRFSLRKIHKRLKDSNLTSFDKVVIPPPHGNKPPKETIPYTFSLSRGRRTPRDLHLMHPYHYQDVIDFYNSYSTQILSNCLKSGWTLRAPSGIARRSKNPIGSSGSQNNPIGIDPTSDGAPVSFFAYGPVSMLYTFFGSRDYECLESRFRYYRAIDVQSCFGNIYSHSISWAVRGKTNAKRGEDRKAFFTFDARFDSLMRSMNHGETHGILVGPELSRVFSEIILQTVDNGVEESLKGEVCFGKQCEVRRYLDDFLIFFNDKNIADKVENRIRSKLKHSKLYINDAKTVEKESPFMSNLSVLKQELGVLIGGVFDSLKSNSSEPFKSSSNSLRVALRQIKKCVSQSDCYYESCISYVLSIIHRKVVLANTKTCNNFVDVGIISLLSRLLELDFRYQVAVKVATLFQLLADKTSSGSSMNYERDVEESIANEVTKIAHNAMSREIPPCLPLLVVLIPIAKIDLVHKANANLANQIWHFSKSSAPDGEVDYFTVISLIYFCGDRSEYNPLKREIICSVKFFLNCNINGTLRADCLMLAADLACCRFLADRDRKAMLSQIKLWGVSLASPNSVLEEIRETCMFFDWNDDVSTASYLLEKQVPRCYS